MKNLIMGLVSLNIIFMMIYTPIFIIFFDSPKSAVESFSLADAMKTYKYTTVDRRSDRVEKDNVVDRIAKRIKRERNIDINQSFYDILKNDKNVKNVTITKYGANNKLESYFILFDINGQKMQIPFICIPSEYFKFKGAKAYTPMDIHDIINIFGPLYGFTAGEIGNFHINAN